MPGYRYVLDSNGDYILDSNGDYIIVAADYTIPPGWETADIGINPCNEPTIASLHLQLQNGQRLEITSLSVTYNQNEINTFDVTVPLRFLTQHPSTYYLDDVFILRNGAEFIRGIIDDYSLSISASSQILVNFRCFDELGKLGTYKAKSTAHYQNQLLIFIISDLLATRDLWELGDTSTMPNPLITTTVDLRNKENLWSQIITAVESIPDLFIRYGGINTTNNKRRIDIGYFDEVSPFWAVQHMNLLELTLNTNNKKVIRSIEAYGGRSGGTKVSLQNALNFDPSLATHPEFPINPSTLEVRNAAIPEGKGYEIVKDYNVNKTRNDEAEPPSQTEIDQAGYALWQNAVRDLKSHEINKQYSCRATFPCTVFGNYSVPLVGNRLYVRGKVTETVIDPTTLLLEQRTVFDVEEPLRITSVQVDFNGGLETYTLGLTETAYKIIDDNSVQLYDKLSNPESAEAANPISALNVTAQTLTFGPGVAADCYYSNSLPQPFDGKVFAFPLPSPPPGAVSVGYSVNILPLSANYHITTSPTLPATGLTLCVVDATLSWTALSQVTITILWVFS